MRVIISEMENPERFIAKEEGIEKSRKKELSPQKLYERGKEPLDVKFGFSTGDQLVAKQQEDGVAEVVIIKDGEKVLDFKDWLGKDFKFVTPTFLLNPGNKVNYFIPGWFADPAAKVISVGYWENPKILVGLLHEIGHSNQNFENLYRLRDHEKREPKNKEIKLALMREVSFLERNAWAFALQKIRELKRERGIDVVGNLFEDLAELKQFIVRCLHTYTETMSVALGSSRFSLPAEAIGQMEGELVKLFDKGFGENK